MILYLQHDQLAMNYMYMRKFKLMTKARSEEITGGGTIKEMCILALYKRIKDEPIEAALSVLKVI